MNYTIQSAFYQTFGLVSAAEWEHSQPEDWITVNTPDQTKKGGRVDQFQKKFWTIDPT